MTVLHGYYEMDRIDLVAELRDVLGLPHPGGWETPKGAWEQALDEVRRLRQLEAVTGEEE